MSDEERDVLEKVDMDDVALICCECDKPVGEWHEEWCAILKNYREDKGQ